MELKDWLKEYGFQDQIYDLISEELEINSIFELSCFLDDNKKVELLRSISDDTITLDLILAVRIFTQKSLQTMLQSPLGGTIMVKDEESRKRPRAKMEEVAMDNLHSNPISKPLLEPRIEPISITQPNHIKPSQPHSNMEQPVMEQPQKPNKKDQHPAQTIPALNITPNTIPTLQSLANMSAANMSANLSAQQQLNAMNMKGLENMNNALKNPLMGFPNMMGAPSSLSMAQAAALNMAMANLTSPSLMANQPRNNDQQSNKKQKTQKPNFPTNMPNIPNMQSANLLANLNAYNNMLNGGNNPAAGMDLSKDPLGLLGGASALQYSNLLGLGGNSLTGNPALANNNLNALLGLQNPNKMSNYPYMMNPSLYGADALNSYGLGSSLANPNLGNTLNNPLMPNANPNNAYAAALAANANKYLASLGQGLGNLSSASNQNPAASSSSNNNNNHGLHGSNMNMNSQMEANKLLASMGLPPMQNDSNLNHRNHGPSNRSNDLNAANSAFLNHILNNQNHGSASGNMNMSNPNTLSALLGSTIPGIPNLIPPNNRNNDPNHAAKFGSNNHANLNHHSQQAMKELNLSNHHSNISLSNSINNMSGGNNNNPQINKNKSTSNNILNSNKIVTTSNINNMLLADPSMLLKSLEHLTPALNVNNNTVAPPSNPSVANIPTNSNKTNHANSNVHSNANPPTIPEIPEVPSLFPSNSPLYPPFASTILSSSSSNTTNATNTANTANASNVTAAAATGANPKSVPSITKYHSALSQFIDNVGSGSSNQNNGGKTSNHPQDKSAGNSIPVVPSIPIVPSISSIPTVPSIPMVPSLSPIASVTSVAVSNIPSSQSNHSNPNHNTNDKVSSNNNIPAVAPPTVPSLDLSNPEHVLLGGHGGNLQGTLSSMADRIILPSTSSAANSSIPKLAQRRSYTWNLIYSLDIKDYDNKYQKAYDMAMQLKNYPNCITEHRHAFNKVFKCREGDDCPHLTKIHHDRDSNCIHIYQSGQHLNHRSKSNSSFYTNPNGGIIPQSLSSHLDNGMDNNSGDSQMEGSVDDSEMMKPKRGLTLKVKKFIDGSITTGVKPRQILEDILQWNRNQQETDQFEVPNLRQIQNYCDRLGNKKPNDEDEDDEGLEGEGEEEGDGEGLGEFEDDIGEVEETEHDGM